MASRNKPAGKPKPVEPRGRRGHKAVDEQPGLREWLIERIQRTPRPTLNEILEELKGTGFSIGRTAVWQFRVTWELQLAERDLALREAQEYAALDDEQPLTLERAIATMGNRAIWNDVRARLVESGGSVTGPIQELQSRRAHAELGRAARAHQQPDRSWCSPGDEPHAPGDGNASHARAGGDEDRPGRNARRRAEGAEGVSFADDLQASLEKHAPKGTPADLRPSSLREFMEKDVVTDVGLWSLDGHEPFAEILGLMDSIFRRPLRDTELSLLKAEQIGATTSLGLGPALNLAADLGRNVGYFLPTDLFARKIGRTRLKNILRKSPRLSAIMKAERDASDGDGLPVNQATVKEFDGKFLYVLGLESMMGAISTPLDVLLNDEVDLLPAENLEWAQGRIAHSDLRASIYFSAGYAPGAGIDLRFQDGSQHKWLVDCSRRSCLKRICLEEVFPDCIGPNPARSGDTYVRICPKCKTPLDIVKNGRWVASFPQREKQRKFSYRLSALAMGAMSADYMMSRWSKCRTKSQKAKFRCSVLAIPDAGAMQPFSDVEINRMQSGECALLRYGRGSLPRFAGVDAGDLYHFVCYERRPNGDPYLVWVEEIDSDVALDRISTLIGKLGIVQLVIDKKPHTTIARALAYRFPRIVALQDFLNGSVLKVADEEHEKKKYRCVKVDRDESLEETTSGFTSEYFLRIPDLETAPVMVIFAEHLKNLRKERSLDKKFRVIDTYLGGVANHCGMALNSARIAEEIGGSAMPFSYTPIAKNSRPLVGTQIPRGSMRRVKGSLMHG